MWRCSAFLKMQESLSRLQLSMTHSEKLANYYNSVLAEVETTINSLGVEEALVHFDFITIKYIEGGSGDVLLNITGATGTISKTDFV